MTAVFAFLPKLAWLSLLVGAVGGAWAFAHAEGDTRSSLLRQAKWLYLGGLLALTLWAVITLYGAFRWGCDPVFGGVSRSPAESSGNMSGDRSELPACP